MIKHVTNLIPILKISVLFRSSELFLSTYAIKVILIQDCNNFYFQNFYKCFNAILWNSLFSKII